MKQALVTVRLPNWLVALTHPNGGAPAPPGNVIESLEGRCLLSAATGAAATVDAHPAAGAAPRMPVNVAAAAGGAVAGLPSADADVHLSARSVDATAGAISGGRFVVAAFTDDDADRDAGDWAASVDWGDGTGAKPSYVSDDPETGGFVVEAAHRFRDAGDYDFVVTLTDTRGATASARAAAHVAAAPIQLTALDVYATEAEPTGTITVARFTVRDPGAVPEDFAATINWGDPTDPTQGAVSLGAGGDFIVEADHTFARAIGSQITVTIVDVADDTTAEAQSAAIVDNAPISVTGIGLSVDEGESTGTIDLATFTDGNPLDAGAYDAIIDWGDGSQPEAGAVVSDEGAGGFIVRAEHVYRHSGTPTVSVTVADPNGGGGSDAFDAEVTDRTISASGADLAGTEGDDAGDVPVATFTDPDPTARASDYTAIVDWGDGTDPSMGEVAGDGDGGFIVTGSHAYAGFGDYAVSVDIAETDDVSTATADSTFAVAAAPLEVIARARGATQGTGTGEYVVARFNGGDPAAVAGDFQVVIDWGDGGDAESGTVVAAEDGDGAFVVRGAHAYAGVGAFTLRVDVTDVVTGATGSDDAKISVANAALAGAGVAVGATRTTPFNGVVAHFTDANPLAVAGDYAATVTWGDGDGSAGVVVANAKGGWDVTGSHVYPAAGSFVVRAVITDGDGGKLKLSAAATVRSPKFLSFPLKVTAAASIGAIRARAFSGVVATLVNPYPNYEAGDLTGVINWGDGKTSAATFAQAAKGGWVVRGQHAWSAAGTFKVTLAITDVFARTVAARTTATVRKGAASAAPPSRPHAGRSQTTAVDFTVRRNRRFTRTVAHVTTRSVSWSAGNFSVVIDWGDGRASVGKVVANPEGGFDVRGQHRYARKGAYAVTVTITKPDSGTVDVRPTARVKRAKSSGVA